MNMLLNIELLTLKLSIDIQHKGWQIIGINTESYEITNNYISCSNDINQNRYKNDCGSNDIGIKTITQW